MKSLTHKILSAACFLVAASATLCRGAVILPYTNDFSSNAADFTTSGGNWTVTGGVYQSSQTDSATYGSMVQVAGGAPADFVLSTSFIITDLSVATFLGFTALSDTSNLGSATIDYYLADVQSNGTVRLLSFENGAVVTNGFTAGAATSLAGGLKLNTMYTATLSGTTTGGILNLSFSVTDGSNTGSISGTDTSPLNTATNQWFGFRNRQGSGAPDTLVVRYDNFSLTAVPEPSAVGFILCGLVAGTVIHRYRRRTKGPAYAR